jgi:hypothetical protein
MPRLPYISFKTPGAEGVDPPTRKRRSTQTGDDYWVLAVYSLVGRSTCLWKLIEQVARSRCYHE